MSQETADRAVDAARPIAGERNAIARARATVLLQRGGRGREQEIALDPPAAVATHWARDLAALLRPRILLMVLLAMAVAMVTVGARLPRAAFALHALFGTAWVIVGAVLLNQRLEMRGDARMPRTAARPLPAGRMSATAVSGLGILATALGLGYLTAVCGWRLAAWAAASWLLYVWIYTPSKTRSLWQTPIGAAAGAMPVLLGAVAVDSICSSAAWTLFAIVFFWQLPHAMAIAWLYREEFAAANVRLAPIVDRSGRTSRGLTLLGASALLPLSAAAGVVLPLPAAVAAALTLLSLVYFWSSARFVRRPCERTARWLLRASVVYLPTALSLIAAPKLLALLAASR